MSKISFNYDKLRLSVETNIKRMNTRIDMSCIIELDFSVVVVYVVAVLIVNDCYLQHDPSIIQFTHFPEHSMSGRW